MYNMTVLDLIKSYTNYTKSIIDHLALYRKKYKNYANVLYSVSIKKYPIIANTRSGDNTTFHDYSDVYNSIMGLECDPYEDIVYVKGLKFYGGKKLLGIVGIFMKDVYKFLPVKDEVVLDIGASIADSSIYFASQGAKSVFALEPDPRIFELAKKNIEINNYSDKIEIIQAGCTGINGEHYDTSKPKQNMTLKQIMNNYEKSPPSILKLGCLGCEYDVLLNTPDEILAKFSHIQVQFHYGYRNIKQKLETCGFKVMFCGLGGPTYVKKPFRMPRICSSNRHTYVLNKMFAGSLCARRV